MSAHPVRREKFFQRFWLASPIFLLTGLLILSSALRASSLGIDTDGRWGPYRFLLVWVGAVLLLVGSLPWLNRLWQRFIYKIWLPRISTPWKTSRACRSLQSIKGCRVLSWWDVNPVRSARLSAIVLLILSGILYIWYATGGYWTDNSKYQSYYQMLTDAFRHGQASLLVEPDPALARIENPYDISQREGISYLWDASYYKGKYYLYWGPAPVLGQLLLEFIMPTAGGDAYLMALFATAMVGALFGNIFSFWKRFFPRIPWGGFTAILFAVAFSNPILWLVGRPASYEIAIIAGQFYFLAGTWAAFPSLIGEPNKTGRLVLAGLCFSLAVLSRSTLAIPVIFLAGYFAWQFIRQRESVWRQLLALGFPLALGAGFTFLYNYIRFDSIFEFGVRFQLSSLNQYDETNKLFSLVYIPMNLFNYLFNPVNVLWNFPYIEPIKATISIKGTGITAPNNYAAQWVSGLLITTPFLFAILALLMQIIQPRLRAGIEPSLRKLITALCSVALLEFGIVQFFYSNSMRYIMDSVPIMLILAGMGVCFFLEWAQHAPHRVWVPWVMAALIFINVCSGLLLGLSSEGHVFESVNPILFEQLSSWFGS